MKPKKQKTRKRGSALSLQELKRFLKVIADSPKHALMFILTLFYGLRVGETAQIKLSNINKAAREITITGLKNGRTQTYVIPPSIFKKLTAWLVERNRNEKVKTNPYLFPHRTKRNAAMTRIGIQYDFKMFCEKAKISKHSVHDLRHTCAMFQVEKGTDPVRLRNWLRQRYLSSTEKYFEEFEDRNHGKTVQKIFENLF
ncbi:Tyrosine recombinase XerC [subsurface metagenome]